MLCAALISRRVNAVSGAYALRGSRNISYLPRTTRLYDSASWKASFRCLGQSAAGVRHTSSSPWSRGNRSTPAEDDKPSDSAPNPGDGSRSNDAEEKPKKDKKKKKKVEPQKKGRSKSTPKIGPRIDLIVEALVDALTEEDVTKTTYYSNLLEVLGGKYYPGEPAWMTALIMSMELDCRSKPTSRSPSQIYANIANRFGAFTGALAQMLSKGDPESPNGSPSAQGRSANPQTKDTLEVKIESRRGEGNHSGDEGQSKSTSVLGPRINLVIKAINDAVAKKDASKITYYSDLLNVIGDRSYPGEPEWMSALAMGMALNGQGELALHENGLALVGGPITGSLSRDPNPGGNSQSNDTAGAKSENVGEKEDKPKKKEQLKSKKTPRAPNEHIVVALIDAINEDDWPAIIQLTNLPENLAEGWYPGESEWMAGHRMGMALSDIPRKVDIYDKPGVISVEKLARYWARKS